MRANHTAMKRTAAALALIAFAAAGAFALKVPALNGPVNDLANVMSAGERQSLDAYLRSVSDQTGKQIAVLTVPSLEGESLEDYSLRVAESWGLGKKGEDGGVLLLVAMAERAIRIEVGYGLEGSLTDAKCGLIIRNVIAPQFRNGRYGQGIAEAARNIVGIATDNAEIVSRSVREESRGSSGGGIGGIAFFIIFFIFILPRLRGRGILGPLILGSMLSSGRRSSWSGGSRGGGFGGGFSGGGGGFGGGGASGGW